MADVVEAGNLIPLGPGLKVGESGRLWEVRLDPSGFDGNLSTTDDSLQKVAQKLDDLVIPTGGGGITLAAAAAQAAAEVPRWTGQETGKPTSLIALNRLPDNVQIVAKAYRSGGPRPYTGTAVQVGGIKDSAYSAADFTAIDSAAWGNTALRAGGGATALDAAHAALRISRTDFNPAPTALPSGFALRSSPELPVLAPGALTFTRLPTADTAQYWAYSVAYGEQPADDNLVLEVVEHASTDLLPPDGSLTPSMLDGLMDAPAGDVVTVAKDDVFGHHTPSSRRELYNGSQGITVASASARSGLSPVAFDSALNRNTAGNVGLVFTTSRRTLVTRSSTSISYQPDRVETTAYASSFVDLATLATYPVYDGVNNLGDAMAAIPVYLAPAGTLLGYEQINIAADATSSDYESIPVFIPSAAHSQSTASWSSSGTTKIDFDDFGASVPGGGVGGQVRSYETALPAAAGIPDGTVGVIETTGRWAVKMSTVTQGAQDTGWAGKEIDPHDLASVQVGPYTVRYAAAAGFTWERNGHRATLAAGGVGAVSGGLPADGRLVWSYETASNGSNLLECDYTVDKAATGRIVFTVGTAIAYAFELRRANGRAWDSGVTGAATRSHLLAGLWRATEPDGTGHTRVESWLNLPVPPSDPQWVDLLDYDPGSGAGPTLGRRVLEELPVGQDFSPALTSAHDNWMLDIEIQVASVNTAEGRIWSVVEPIRCLDWRVAPNSPDDANMSNVAVDGAWTCGVFMSDNAAANDSWGRFVICKGPNGRLGIIWAGPGAVLRRVLVRRHT